MRGGKGGGGDEGQVYQRCVGLQGKKTVEYCVSMFLVGTLVNTLASRVTSLDGNTR